MGEAMAPADTPRSQKGRQNPVQRLVSPGPRMGGRQPRSQPRRQRNPETCGASGSDPRRQARRKQQYRWLLGPLLPVLLLAGTIPASQAAPWKDCSFNDRPIPCRDSHFADGSVRIVWQDGLAMTYRLIQAGFPISILGDSLGGRWRREILVQGNAVFVNPANGNRIVVPLR